MIMKNAAQAAISLVLIALLATGATISACSSADAQGGNSGARLNAALDEAGVESITGQIKVVHVTGHCRSQEADVHPLN